MAVDLYWHCRGLGGQVLLGQWAGMIGWAGLSDRARLCFWSRLYYGAGLRCRVKLRGGVRWRCSTGLIHSAGLANWTGLGHRALLLWAACRRRAVRLWQMEKRQKAKLFSELFLITGIFYYQKQQFNGCMSTVRNLWMQFGWHTFPFWRLVLSISLWSIQQTAIIGHTLLNYTALQFWIRQNL